MNQDLYHNIVEIMIKVQQSTSIHQKCRYTLLNVLKESHDQFYSCFEQILTMILLESNKNDSIYVERCMDFCTSFCALSEVVEYCEQNSLDLLHEKVLYFLLDLHNLESDVVRFRVCKMISKLLTVLIDVDLDEELFEHLKVTMLERVIDPKSDIRLQVINGIYRLQNPSDSECQVISMFLKRMNCDSIAKVRKACVEKIAIKRDVIDSLILRTRDVNVDVRLASFTRMLNLVKFLRIKHRHCVIKNGILDESDRVQSFVKNQLVEAWLKEFNFNYLDFLKGLRLDSNAEDIATSVKVAEFVLDCLFRSQPGEEILKVINLTNNFVVYEELNWESAMFWRYLANTCRKSQKLETFLDDFLPDLVDLVKYIKGYCVLKAGDGSSKEFQFVLKQLLMMTCEYDLVDTSSRQALNQLINDVLCNYNLDEDVVEVVIKNMERSVPNDEHRERFVLEIISEVTCPMVNDEPVEDVVGKMMELKQRVGSLKSNQEAALKEENYLMAGQYQQEINDLVTEISNLTEFSAKVKTVERKSDSETLLKCLAIERGYLRSNRFTRITSNFRPMCDEIIQMLTNFDDRIRCKALECYVLCCVVDKEMASKGIHVFYGSVLANVNNDNCDVDSLLVSIKGMVDMLLVYGQDIITQSSPGTNEGSLFSFTTIIQLLVNLMDDENVGVQECAGKGLCMIILNRGIFSPNLIARMILKWCNPSSEEDDSQLLRQTIGITLEEIPSVLDCTEHLDDAFFITLQTLLNAPNTSPLSQVNVPDIIKFMLNLCRLCRRNMTFTHKNIATKLICEIIDHPDSQFSATYSKILLMLDTSSWNQITCHELELLCNDVTEHTTSRTILNTVAKFQAQLNKFNDGQEE